MVVPFAHPRGATRAPGIWFKLFDKRGTCQPRIISFVNESIICAWESTADLWLPNAVPSSRSDLTQSCERGSNGQCPPEVRVLQILLQLGWCSKTGAKMDTGRHSEPGCNGEFGSCMMADFMS